jgi:hypothetical protein
MNLCSNLHKFPMPRNGNRKGLRRDIERAAGKSRFQKRATTIASKSGKDSLPNHSRFIRYAVIVAVAFSRLLFGISRHKG